MSVLNVNMLLMRGTQYKRKPLVSFSQRAFYRPTEGFGVEGEGSVNNLSYSLLIYLHPLPPSHKATEQNGVLSRMKEPSLSLETRFTSLALNTHKKGFWVAPPTAGDSLLCLLCFAWKHLSSPFSSLVQKTSHRKNNQKKQYHNTSKTRENIC